MALALKKTYCFQVEYAHSWASSLSRVDLPDLGLELEVVTSRARPKQLQREEKNFKVADTAL